MPMHTLTEQLPTLRIGMRGPAVTNLQRLLLASGFDPGPLDGIFGPKTQNALQRFQFAVGLPATGIADPVTWDRLKRAVIAAPPEERMPPGPEAMGPLEVPPPKREALTPLLWVIGGILVLSLVAGAVR